MATSPSPRVDTMRASVLVRVGEIQQQERSVPTPGPGEVLVRVASVGVCGSDVHWFRDGRIGDLCVTGPLVLGHELSGRVAAVGDGVDASRIGQRVAVEPQRPCRVCSQCTQGRYNLCPFMEFFGTPPVDGAFCEYVTAPAVFAHPVRAAVTDDVAALLEPLSVAIAACRKAGVVPGSRVLVAGAGPIGLITVQTAKAFGAAEVVVTETVAERRQVATGFGADHVLDPRTQPVADLGVDAFIDCSGAPPAINAGITAVRPAGSVVLVGMGPSLLEMPFSVIQNRELVVTGVYRYANTWPLAEQLAATGQVDLAATVTGHFDLAHVTEALDAGDRPGAVKAIVTV